jgi:hypothetical protein
MKPSRSFLAAAALASAAALPTTAPAASVTPVARHTPYVSTPIGGEPIVGQVLDLDYDPANPPVEAPPRIYTPVPAAPGAMFRTPEDAMRYLVTAYNNHDLAALKHVTNPSARTALEAMRAQASDLRLKACAFDKYDGDYECTFSHGFPASLHRTDRGSAVFTVGPAAKPGWYMTVLDSCGG